MKYEFSSNKIKIRPIYLSDELKNYDKTIIISKKIKDVYGIDLKVDNLPLDRPFLYASYVESMDGKLAYADIPDAFYVAQKNILSEFGKNTDFWILNMLRYIADACVIGGNTLNIDPDDLMINLDEELYSEVDGEYKYPIQIVTSIDGTDIPLNHKLLHQNKYPRIISTSEKGYIFLKNNYEGNVIKVNSDSQFELHSELVKESLYVLATGEDIPQTEDVMRFFKINGVNYMLIESPGFGDHLIHKKMLDEIFFNFSCVYIGGANAMTMGKNSAGFTAELHPHARVLSIHVYNDFYFYFRYKMEYSTLG